MSRSDNDTAIAELCDAVQRFVAERDWGQFHNAKALSLSLCIEAAELLEEFQWLRPEEVEAASRDAQARARVADELADVLIYAFSLANALDLDVATAVREYLAHHLRRVQEQGHRAVVTQPHLHVGLELALSHGHPFFPQERGETRHQWLGHLRGSSIGETGTPTLASVAVEGELRDHQHAATHIGQGQVHLAGIIFEDPQVGDLTRQDERLFLSIAVRHSQQHQKSTPDLADQPAFYSHRSLAHPLHHGAHSLHPP